MLRGNPGSSDVSLLLSENYFSPFTKQTWIDIITTVTFFSSRHNIGMAFEKNIYIYKGVRIIRKFLRQNSISWIETVIL